VVTTPFEILTEMGRRGRARVVEQHDIRRIGQRLAILMQSIQFTWLQLQETRHGA